MLGSLIGKSTRLAILYKFLETRSLPAAQKASGTCTPAACLLRSPCCVTNCCSRSAPQTPLTRLPAAAAEANPAANDESSKLTVEDVHELLQRSGEGEGDEGGGANYDG